MKTKLYASLAAAAMLLGGAASIKAQEPVSTGIIQGVQQRAGMLTIRSDQTQRPITFYGLQRANIYTADGQIAQLEDLQGGMPITVQYALRGRHWYISKVILPEQRGGATSFAFGGSPLRSYDYRSYDYYSDPAWNSRAAWDRDITTNPGSRAAIDNDITTQPASSGRRGAIHWRAP